MATARTCAPATYPREPLEEDQNVKTCPCGIDTVTLTGSTVAVRVCLRCDTSAQGNGVRVGPPNLPGTNNGWFNAPFGDRK